MKRSEKTLNIGEDGIHKIVGKFWYEVESSNAEENGKFVHLSMDIYPCKSLHSRKPFVLAKPSIHRMHSRHHCLLIAINNHEALTF